MCYNGFEPGDTEAEREAAEPWETEGDLPFLPDKDAEAWRRGFPMGPEERMWRDTDDGGTDGPAPPQR